jgi:hypothetical protein
MSSLSITVTYSAGSVVINGPGTPQVIQISTPGTPGVIQLGTLSAAVSQQINQAVSQSAASATAAANAYSAIANGTATSAGTLTGAETVPVSRGAGLLQTTWNAVANFVISIFAIVFASGIGAALRTLLAKLLDYPVSPYDYGAKGDTVILSDGIMAAGQKTLTSASAAFSSADVGKVISVQGAGANGVPLAATITSYVGANQVTLSVAASNSVGGASFTGSISGTTLTVSAISSGVIALGQSVSGAAAGMIITGMGGATFTGSISGQTLTVTTVSAGTISLGQTLSGTGISGAVTIIGSGLTGTTYTGTGGTGTYKISSSLTIASEAMTTCFGLAVTTGRGGVGTYIVSKSQTVASGPLSTIGASFSYGTDDSNAVQAWYNACSSFKLSPAMPGGCVCTLTKTVFFNGTTTGVPRLSKFVLAAGFTFGGYGSQFALINSNFSLSYSSATAQNVSFDGVDFASFSAVILGSGVIGLANVSGGRTRNCEFSSYTACAISSFLDLYAVVKNYTVAENKLTSTTQAGALGGLMWIRNLTSDGSVSINVTENILVERNYLGQSGFDEAVAIYGVNGLVRNVTIRSNKIEGLPSATCHGTLASTFPFGPNQGGTSYAAIQDILWDDNEFIDVAFLNEVLRFGSSSDTAQTIQAVASSHNKFTVSMPVANTASSVLHNVADTFTGTYSGISSESDIINTQASANQINVGISGFSTIQNPTIQGSVFSGISGGAVMGGSVESYGYAFYQCSSVTGSKFKVDGPYPAFYQNSAVNSNYVGNTGTSAGSLATIGSAASYVALTANLCAMSSASSYAVLNQGSARVLLRNNGLTGTGLTTTGTIAYTAGNDYFGTIA